MPVRSVNWRSHSRHYAESRAGLSRERLRIVSSEGSGHAGKLSAADADITGSVCSQSYVSEVTIRHLPYLKDPRTSVS